MGGGRGCNATEDEACRKVHGKRYEVPRVTMHMECMDSDNNVKEPHPYR